MQEDHHHYDSIMWQKKERKDPPPPPCGRLGEVRAARSDKDGVASLGDLWPKKSGWLFCLGFRVYRNCIGFVSGVLGGFWAGFERVLSGF